MKLIEIENYEGISQSCLEEAIKTCRTWNNSNGNDTRDDKFHVGPNELFSILKSGGEILNLNNKQVNSNIYAHDVLYQGYCFTSATLEKIDGVI